MGPVNHQEQAIHRNALGSPPLDVNGALAVTDWRQLLKDKLSGPALTLFNQFLGFTRRIPATGFRLFSEHPSIHRPNSAATQGRP